MHQLQLFIGNWQSDDKAAAQARYLTALLLCSLLLVGFSAGVFGWRPLVLAIIAGFAGMAVELAFAAVRKKPVTGGAFVYGLALSDCLTTQTDHMLADTSASLENALSAFLNHRKA